MGKGLSADSPDYDPLNFLMTINGTGNITACGESAPAEAGGSLVSCYHYDEAGRQDEVWHPDGTVTRYEFDELGRMLLTVENRPA